MSVDFDRLTYGRRSRSTIENFLQELPHAADARADAIAERTVSIYVSHAASETIPSAAASAEDYLLHSSNRRLSISPDAWWKEIQPLAEAGEEKRSWDVAELRRIRNFLAHANLDSPRFSSRPLTGGTEPRRGSVQAVRVVSLARMHAVMWVALVLFALFWGVVAGAAFFAGVGLSPSVATFGVLGTVALSATLFTLSIQDATRKHGR